MKSVESPNRVNGTVKYFDIRRHNTTPVSVTGVHIQFIAQIRLFIQNIILL